MTYHIESRTFLFLQWWVLIFTTEYRNTGWGGEAPNTFKEKVVARSRSYDTILKTKRRLEGEYDDSFPTII